MINMASRVEIATMSDTPIAARAGPLSARSRLLRLSIATTSPLIELPSASFLLIVQSASHDPTSDQPIATDTTTARLVRSEEHTSELQSLMRISYAVFCLKKKKKKTEKHKPHYEITLNRNNRTETANRQR